MLTEIYAWEKLRDLEAEAKRPHLRAGTATGTGLSPRAVTRVLGGTLRRLGQRLESWSAPPISTDASRELTGQRAAR